MRVTSLWIRRNLADAPSFAFSSEGWETAPLPIMSSGALRLPEGTHHGATRRPKTPRQEASPGIRPLPLPLRQLRGQQREDRKRQIHQPDLRVVASRGHLHGAVEKHRVVER